MNLDRLDAWITSGRYSNEPVDFECQECGYEWAGTVESEYGSAEYAPHDECPNCGSDDLDYSPAEPPDHPDV